MPRSPPASASSTCAEAALSVSAPPRCARPQSFSRRCIGLLPQALGVSQNRFDGRPWIEVSPGVRHPEERSPAPKSVPLSVQPWPRQCCRPAPPPGAGATFDPHPEGERALLPPGDGPPAAFWKRALLAVKRPDDTMRHEPGAQSSLEKLLVGEPDARFRRIDLPETPK